MSSMDYIAGAAVERNINEAIRVQEARNHANEMAAMQRRVNAKMDELYGKVDDLQRELSLRDEMLMGAGIAPPQKVEKVEKVINPDPEPFDVGEELREMRAAQYQAAAEERLGILKFFVMATVCAALALGSIEAIKYLRDSGIFTRLTASNPITSDIQFLKPAKYSLEAYACTGCHSVEGEGRSFDDMRAEVEKQRTIKAKWAVYNRYLDAVSKKPVVVSFGLSKDEKDILVQDILNKREK